MDELEMPPELALVGRMIDRLGPRVRTIGGSVRWVVDGATWDLDLEVDGGRWRRGGAVAADVKVTASGKGVCALFGSAEELRAARLEGELQVAGDLDRLVAIGAALGEGGSFLTHLARRKAR